MALEEIHLLTRSGPSGTQEDFDLVRAWKHSKIQTTGELAGESPVLLEPQFTRWMTDVLDAHRARGDELRGAQDMME